MPTLGVTGFRPKKMPWGYDSECQAAVETRKELGKIMEQAYNDGFRDFISGMALGADTWFAIETLYLPEARLHCYIPFRGQEHQWDPEEQDEYHDLLREAYEVKYFAKGYSKRAYLDRDMAVVDNSDLIVAIWDGKTTGGTQYTVEYARKVGVPVKIVDPVYYWEKYKS